VAADPAWDQFKAKFGKSYASMEEELAHYETFTLKLAKIEAHNADPNRSYDRSLNVFSDQTFEQLSAKYLKGVPYVGHPMPEGDAIYPGEGEFECPEEFKKSMDIPEEFMHELDWRVASKNPAGRVAVPAIKNQADCGSCYSFSAIATMEANLCMKGEFDCENWNGLSEQQPMDCGSYITVKKWHALKALEMAGYVEKEIEEPESNVPWHSYEGCKGGFQSNVWQHIYQQGGIASEDTYPYSGGDNLSNGGYMNIAECPYQAKNQYQWMRDNSVAFIDKTICGTTSKFNNTDPENIKQALFEKGPLSMGISIGDTEFFEIGSDPNYIYIPEIVPEHGNVSCEVYDINHAINVVGYGTSDEGVDYWLVRNSWGTHWGVDGYAKLVRGQNACNIEVAIQYVNLETDYDMLKPSNDVDDDEDDTGSAPRLGLASALLLLAALN